MIYLKLTGGLGNQLFQYAAGMALAEHHHTGLKLDIRNLEKNPLRSYELHNFNISAEIAASDELKIFDSERRSFVSDCADRFMRKLKPYYRQNIYYEQGFHHDPNFFKAPKQVYLVGYWQSEKYFKHMSQTIRNECRVVPSPEKTNIELLETISRCNAVCIHVRRGDYANDSKTRDYHGLCSPDYYEQATRQLCRKVVSPHFFVFSDDMEWTRNMIKLPGPTTFVDHNPLKNAFEDFRLMCKCRHHIIANSSFSWWAAWLSEHDEKTVFAPKKWFNKNNLNTKDLIPEKWSTL